MDDRLNELKRYTPGSVRDCDGDWFSTGLVQSTDGEWLWRRDVEKMLNTRATDPLFEEMAAALDALIKRAAFFGYGFALGHEMADGEEALQRWEECK